MPAGAGTVIYEKFKGTADFLPDLPPYRVIPTIQRVDCDKASHYLWLRKI